MVRIISYLTILALTSCGHGPRPNSSFLPALPEYDIDPSIVPLIDEFVQDALRYNIDLADMRSKLRIIKFKMPKEGYAGTCYLHRHEGEVHYTEIILDPRYRTYTTSLRGLMYHELGHCLLLKAHSNEVPKTIMSPTLASECFYRQLWTKLVKNLFTDSSIDYTYEKPCNASLISEKID
jgi:hypothetical protein